MIQIPISTEYIKLGQLLKLAGVLSQGSDVKALLLEEKIFVNGQIATQRGKKIVPNDIVTIKDLEEIQVLSDIS